MRNVISKYWKLSLTLLFGVVVFWFWAVPYLSVMSFQEQYQLFLFGSGYFWERITVPGGLADYIGEFLTQLNYMPVVGAAILAVLYMLLQRTVWVLCRRVVSADGSNGQGGSDRSDGIDGWYPISFLPSVMLWIQMGDENVMISFIIALLAALWAMVLYHVVSRDEAFPSSKYIKLLYIIVALPLMYWLFGPCMLMVAVYIAVFELIRGRSLACLAMGVLVLIYALAIILICAKWLQYPMFNLFAGINYYRYPQYVPAMQTAIEVVATLLPFILTLLPTWRKKTLAVITQIVVLVGGGWFFVSHAYDPMKYDLIEYDFLVRTKQWSKIILKAEKKQPSRPFDVSCVNLALVMQGQLSDRLFEFYQHGAEGLFPAFQRDMTTPLPTSEVFYRLGMVNDAERYAFEAQEAIPNHRKSGRLTKRIIECNIINGQYEVAMKYLRMLEKSLFYAGWAKEQKEMIRKGKVNDDPVYYALRSYRQQRQDFLFSDTEMDQMLGLLYVQNYGNRMAFEYLMCYELLQRDLDRFNQYYPLGKYAHFNRIPTAYQQALVMQWTQQHGSFDGMPWSIEPGVCQMLNQFVGIFMKNQQDPSLRQPPLSNTFWSYYLVGEEGREKQGKQPMREIY